MVFAPQAIINAIINCDDDAHYDDNNNNNNNNNNSEKKLCLPYSSQGSKTGQLEFCNRVAGGSTTG